MAFHRQALLDAAHQAGYRDLKPRLIGDWVEIGLLDTATRHGLGQGRGSESTWTPEQRDLFLEILATRRRLARERGVDDRHIRPITPLFDVPIGRWLRDDPPVAVSLRQVERALKNWVKGQYGDDPTSERAARRYARDVVRQVDNANAHARQGARDAIAAATPLLISRDEVVRRWGIGVVRDALRDLVRDRPVDVQGRFKEVAYRLAFELRARLAAAEHPEAFTEDEYVAAREDVRALTRIAENTPVGYSGACSALLTTLGSRYLMRTDTAPKGAAVARPLQGEDLEMLYEIAASGIPMPGLPERPAST